MSLQQQRQVPQQLEVLNEFQYTINKDMQNMLGIAVEFFAIEEIKNQIDPELYKVQKNRLILQHNLSNTIHFDQQETSKAKNLESQLSGMKSSGKDIFCKAKQELQSSIPNFETSEAYQILEQYEKNNFGTLIHIKQLQNEKINVKSTFDEKVLSQITAAMQQTDQQYEEVRNGKTKLEFDQFSTIMQNARNRYESAKFKLSQLYNPNNRINQCVPELRLLLGSLFSYFIKKADSEKQRVLLEILGLQEAAFQKDNVQYQEQLDKIKKGLPSFSQFFSFFMNHYKFSLSLQSKENPIFYLPMTNSIQQGEMQLLNENYQESLKIVRKTLLSYLLKFYQEPQKIVSFQKMTIFEQDLLREELKKLLPNMKSTFMKYLIENLMLVHSYKINKGYQLSQEEEDILYLNQQLSLLDS